MREFACEQSRTSQFHHSCCHFSPNWDLDSDLSFIPGPEQQEDGPDDGGVEQGWFCSTSFV